MTTSHDDLASRLRAAYAGGAVPPLRDGLEPTDATGAYAVAGDQHPVLAGARPAASWGRKAGLTAKAVQVQLGVDQPDFGALFDDMRVADGGALDPAKCLQPKAEAEIAFVLAADLPGPETTAEQVAAAVATVPCRDRDRRQPHCRLEDHLCRYRGRQRLLPRFLCWRKKASSSPGWA